MKASLFCTARYIGTAPHDIWPLSGEYYSGDVAVRSMQTAFDQFRRADEFGFDWVTVAEHHYSAFSLRACQEIIESTSERVKYGFTTV
jgi:hypothetical protein